jgi:hypothetical protein
VAAISKPTPTSLTNTTTNTKAMTNTLKQHLKKLRLSRLLSSLEVRLHEAEANRLPYAEFLDGYPNH